MKKLLVGSVFADDSPLQQKWLDLQLRYLAATTTDYDHVVVLTPGPANDSFTSRTTVLVPEDTTLSGSPAHVQGLNLLRNHFRDREDYYENFLFIDGDAFPIKKQWLGSLLVKMNTTDRFTEGAATCLSERGNYYDTAVALRCENLETRLHASVLFARREALRHITFEVAEVGYDLAGNPECDVTVPAYQHHRRRLAMPLLRTNQYNLHPLACGVYYDMFYHHCCGSGRWFNMRANDYYDRIVPRRDDLSQFTNQLFADPNGFVGKLAGWSPQRYASV